MAEFPKFYIGDKVRHKQAPSLGALEVTGISKEQVWPDKGPVRRIFWKTLSEEIQPTMEDWTWDFALEAW